MDNPDIIYKDRWTGKLHPLLPKGQIGIDVNSDVDVDLKNDYHPIPGGGILYTKYERNEANVSKTS